MAHFLKHQFWWNVEYKIILFHILPLCLCNSRFGISWTILHVAACKGKSASTRNSACDCAEDLLTTRGSSCLVWWPQWTWSASWHPPQTTAVGHPSQHTRPHHRGHLHRGQPVGQEQISIPDVHVEQPVSTQAPDTSGLQKSIVHLCKLFYKFHDIAKLVIYSVPVSLWC